MLHIVNGESTAATLRRVIKVGEIFSFADCLFTGPAPANFEDEAWLKLRADHLASAYAVNRQSCEQGLLRQAEIFRSFSQHDEIVLWFEHDLFCQLNLLFVLDWFAHVDLGMTRLSLINIGEFPQCRNFHGLGELDEQQLGSLLPERHEVTGEEFATASDAFRAFTASEPTEIEKLLQTDTGSIPFLRPAFVAHLKRFPSVFNGLGRIENLSLQLIADGRDRFIDLFKDIHELESVYGIGDAQVWLSLLPLADGPRPLLAIDGATAGPQQLTGDVAQKIQLKLTPDGRHVLQGEEDFVALNGIDQWLGGVHLRGKGPVWRWNDQTSSLRLS